MGGCGLNQIDGENRRANLGYWVRTSATGQGVARSAIRELVDWAYQNTNLIRLELIISSRNSASLRTAENAGAVREGILKNRLLLHGKPHDARCIFIHSQRLVNLPSESHSIRPEPIFSHPYFEGDLCNANFLKTDSSKTLQRYSFAFFEIWSLRSLLKVPILKTFYRMVKISKKRNRLQKILQKILKKWVRLLSSLDNCYRHVLIFCQSLIWKGLAAYRMM